VKKLVWLVPVLVGMWVACVSAAPMKAAKAPAMAGKLARAATIVTPNDLKWTPMAGMEGVEVSPIQGSMSKGPYLAFVKLSGNQVHPLHTHSFAVKLVVISGEFKYTPEGGPEVTLGPGSYLEVPGHLKHTSGTGSGDCVIFQEQSGPWDLKPVETAHKMPK